MDAVNENYSNNNPRPNTVIDLFLTAMDIVITYAMEISRSAGQTIGRLLNNMKITDLIDTAGDHLAAHPVLGFGVLAMALSCAVPVVVFIIFAIISLVFTFAGFIFVEGTLLAVGCMCLFGCLVSMILVMSVMAVVLGVLYYAVVTLGNFINSCEPTKALVNSMVPLLTGSDNNFPLSSSSVADTHQD